MINEKQTGRQNRNSYQCVCLIKTHGQMHRKQGERTHNYMNQSHTQLGICIYILMYMHLTYIHTYIEGEIYDTYELSKRIDIFNAMKDIFAILHDYCVNPRIPPIPFRSLVASIYSTRVETISKYYNMIMLFQYLYMCVVCVIYKFSYKPNYTVQLKQTKYNLRNVCTRTEERQKKNTKGNSIFPTQNSYNAMITHK